MRLSIVNIIDTTKTVFIRYPNEIFSWFLFTRFKNSEIISKSRLRLFILLLSKFSVSVTTYCCFYTIFSHNTGEINGLVLHCVVMQGLNMLFKIQVICSAQWTLDKWFLFTLESEVFILSHSKQTSACTEMNPFASNFIS